MKFLPKRHQYIVKEVLSIVGIAPNPGDGAI